LIIGRLSPRRGILGFVRVEVRRATAADQEAIAALVRAARLNTRGLDWPGFVVVADAESGDLVGVAQIRVGPDAARELASLVVVPAARGHGVATRLVDALLPDDRGGVVYAVVDRPYVGHFARWGFAPVPPGALPPSVARTYRVGRVITTLLSPLARRWIRLVPIARA
jgi:N-acetylglutamate synthase-like GNAT family acetyltransferase